MCLHILVYASIPDMFCGRNIDIGHSSLIPCTVILFALKKFSALGPAIMLALMIGSAGLALLGNPSIFCFVSYIVVNYLVRF